MRFYLEYLRSLRRRSRGAALYRSRSGFTITEVLVASLIMLVAVAIAGNGVVNLLRNSYKANADSELRNNVNRTLEFISNEVRRAQFIADRQDRITTLPAGVTAKDVVLAFQIPDPNNPSQPLKEQIVYYVRDKENPWLGPKVLWRYGPRFDGSGNYQDAGVIGNWETTPIMDLVMNDPDKDSRPDCDPFRKGTLSGWEMFPSSDSKVQGIYSCVKSGGSQVILIANTKIDMTTNDAAAYALSTKISTRASNAPFYLASSGSGSGTETPDPTFPSSDDPTPDPPFTTDPNQPNRIFLTKPATVTNTVTGNVPGTCTTCSVTIPTKDVQVAAMQERMTLAVDPVAYGTAGDEIIVSAGGMVSSAGTTRTQKVEIFSDPTGVPNNVKTIIGNPSIGANQVLVVLTNISPRDRNRGATYAFLLTITPR